MKEIDKRKRVKKQNKKKINNADLTWLLKKYKKYNQIIINYKQNCDNNNNTSSSSFSILFLFLIQFQIRNKNSTNKNNSEKK